MKKPLLLTISLICVVAASPVYAASAADALVAKKASILSKMHRKAEKALVNTAQDRAFSSFFEADAANRHEHKSRIEKISLQVQSRFHVEEMCFIDAKGPELARIVGQEIASDLSPDESGANFFKPGFAQKPRRTFISPIYMSPDANKWVLAYVTPIAVAGTNRGILHYEHGLDAYQAALNKGLKGSAEFLVATNKDGWLISDSRAAIAVTKSGDKEAEQDYFKKLTFGGKDAAQLKQAIDSKQAISADGKNYSGAYKAVDEWTLFAFTSN